MLPSVAGRTYRYAPAQCVKGYPFVWGWNPTHPDRPQKNGRGEYVGGTTNVWATIAAVDLESGDIKWQIPFGTLEEMAPWPFYHFIEGGLHSGGPMVTAGGLIFVGAASDGYFRAFNTETGEELWRYKLPATANSVPMSYRYSGEQYVVVAAGGHFTSPMPSGDYLMAFKLKK